MKVNVVKNCDGKVLVISEIEPDPKKVQVTPVCKEGESIEEIEVPENYSECMDELVAKWEGGKAN